MPNFENESNFVEVPSFKINKEFAHVYKTNEGRLLIDLAIPSSYYKWQILHIVDGRLVHQRISDNYSRVILSVDYDERGVPHLESIGMWNAHFLLIMSVALIQVIIVYYLYKNYRLVKRP